MKRLLLLTILLSSSAFGLNLQCVMYGVNCPRPCDRFEKSYPNLKSINDTALCVVRKKDMSKFAGAMNFLTPVENTENIFIELKDGSKLMAVTSRVYSHIEREKRTEIERRGVEMRMLTKPQLQIQQARSWSSPGKNFFTALKNTLKSDDIGKDDCELIKDVIDRELKDTHSDRAREKIKQDTCREYHEKVERNKKDIEKIKDRI